MCSHVAGQTHASLKAHVCECIERKDTFKEDNEGATRAVLHCEYGGTWAVCLYVGL